MIISAIAIGLLCAYHFGLRAGMVAAGITIALLLAALVMPGHALAIYAIVGVGVIGICLVGPKVARDEARPIKRGLKTVINVAKQVVKRARK